MCVILTCQPMSPRRSVYLKTQNHHVVSRLIFSLTPLQRRIRWTTNFRLYSSVTFQQFKQLCRTSACDQVLLLQFHGHYLGPLSQSSPTAPEILSGSLSDQKEITCVSPVEVFATRIKIFDQQKVCLITWSTLLKRMISWFYGVKGQIAAPYFLILWFL